MIATLPEVSLACRADEVYTQDGWQALSSWFEAFLQEPDGRKAMGTMYESMMRDAREALGRAANDKADNGNDLDLARFLADSKGALIRFDVAQRSSDGYEATLNLRWADHGALRSLVDRFIRDDLREVEANSLALRTIGWVTNKLGLGEVSDQAFEDARQERVQERRAELLPLLACLALRNAAALIVALGAHMGVTAIAMEDGQPVPVRKPKAPK